jgi:hypothetical protein
MDRDNLWGFDGMYLVVSFVSLFFQRAEEGTVGPKRGQWAEEGTVGRRGDSGPKRGQWAEEGTVGRRGDRGPDRTLMYLKNWYRKLKFTLISRFFEVYLCVKHIFSTKIRWKLK